MKEAYRDIDAIYFIWNADSSLPGWIAAAKDYLLDTKPCALCKTAYAGLRAKAEWKAFKAEIPVPVEVLYKNRLDPRLEAAAAGEFPAVLVDRGGELHKLLDRADIEGCEADLQRFVRLFEARISRLSAHRARIKVQPVSADGRLPT